MIIFVLIIIIIVVLGAHGSHPSPTTPTAVPRFHASIVSENDPTDPTDPTIKTPKTITVVFRVTNVGKAAGKPTCSITAIGTTGHANGSTVVTLTSSVSPGETVTSSTTLRITTTRAGRITSTDVKISCT